MTWENMLGREGDEVTQNGGSCIMRMVWWYLECAYNSRRTKLLMVLKQIPSTVHARIQALARYYLFT
jgi:hypothetical protein